jgi:3-dehydroquinate synthase II/3-amino-4-hydroxybenzoic acid synthase
LDNEKNLNREVWFDGRKTTLERQDIWGLIHNSPINKILVTIEQRKMGHFPHKTQFITQVNSQENLNSIDKSDIILSDNQEILELAKEKGFRTCAFFDVKGREALEQSWQDARKYDYALVDFDLPTNIPLELIIARLQDNETVLLKRVTSFEDMEVVFGVMEKGSDGVLLASEDFQEIEKVSEYLMKKGANLIELHSMVVCSVDHIGMGMRSCIDTLLALYEPEAF